MGLGPTLCPIKGVSGGSSSRAVLTETKNG
jgi:hypothetical protein